LFFSSESLDALKDVIQLSILNGEQRQTKEILRWTRRKQRRHIRTNELYDYLINRPSDDLVHPIETMNSTNQPPIVDDLQTFREALVINGNILVFFERLFIFCYLDHENPNRLGLSSYDHSEQLESFVRQQVADQLARKRDYHSTDFISNDFQKSKRARHQ